MWLLDTNAWVRYLHRRPSPIQEQLRARRADQILLCDIVKMELYYGAYKSQRVEKNLATLQTIFAQFKSLPFDGQAARIAGNLRSDLAQRGTPIGPYDLQIAAIALAHGVTLVTHNTREFGRIDGLQLEDWEVAA